MSPATPMHPFPSSPPSTVKSENSGLRLVNTKIHEQCSFCEMPLDVTLVNESLMNLNCGHIVHCHCYHQLKLVSGKRHTSCGICGNVSHPESVEDFTYEPVDEAEFAPPFDVKDGISEPDFAEPYSASSLFEKSRSKIELRSPFTAEDKHLSTLSNSVDETHQLVNDSAVTEDIVNPESQWHKVNELDTVEILADIPSFDSRFLEQVAIEYQQKQEIGVSRQQEHRSLVSSMRSAPEESSKYVSFGNQKVPIRIALQPVSRRVYRKASRTTVMLNVSVPDNIFSHYDYRMNADDFEYGLRIQEALRQLTFKGFPLRNLKPGALRLHDRLLVSQDLGNTWHMEYWYLFSKYLVILRHYSDHKPVKAVLDVRCHVASVQQVPGKNHPLALKLHLSNVQIPDLLLETSDSFRVDCWRRAFEDSSVEFPLAPNFSYGVERALKCPLRVILCLPSSMQAVYIEEIMSLAKLHLHPCDKLGIINYTTDGVIRSSPPIQRDHISIDSFVGQSKVRITSKSQPDSLLRVASTMLDVNRTHEDMTSIIIVNNEPGLNIDAIPEAILSSGIPIHTVGVATDHDSIKLSTLSHQTKGTYSYCLNYDEVIKVFESLITAEGKYTHRNVSVKIIPRIGVKLLGLSGTSASPDMSELLCGSIISSQKPSLLPQDANTWTIGNMREGDTKSILLDIEISSLAALPTGTCDLIAAQVTATKAGENNRQEVTTRLPVQFCEEIQTSDDYVAAARRTGVHATEVLGNVVKKCFTRSRQEAVGVLLKEIAELDNVIQQSTISSSGFNYFLAEIKNLYQEGVLCLQNGKDVKEFELSALYHAWIFAAECVHISRGPIAALYFEPRTSGVALV